jgi:penicillin-binding protein 1A
VAAVWFGNDNYGPTNKLTGGRLPAMTWKKFMTYAHKNTELKPLPFVEAEKPSEAIEKGTPDSDKPADIPLVLARQKPLPLKTGRLLRALAQDLRAAAPLEKVTVSGLPQNSSLTVNSVKKN